MQSMSQDRPTPPQVSDAASTGCLLAVVAVIIASAIWFASSYWPPAVMPAPEEREEEREVAPQEPRSTLIDRFAIDHLEKKGDLLDSDPGPT